MQRSTRPPTLSGNTLTIKGHLGTDVSRAQLEQRVVNPDLTGTDVARRDIRALPGPLMPAARGGYSSSLTITGNEFTATYVFDDPGDRAIAANGGGERIMSWQLQDADGNRQGLTIARVRRARRSRDGRLPGRSGRRGRAASPARRPSCAPRQDELQVNWAPATVAAPARRP